jgi:hypothetical protein
MQMPQAGTENACIYLKVVASGFESLSLDDRLNGCIGALDGWLF